jgi:hypothetical protein
MRRNDRRDYDSHELLLLRVGHHIVRDLRRKGVSSSEQALLWQSAALVWEAKRLYRVEQASKRALAFAEMKARRGI